MCSRLSNKSTRRKGHVYVFALPKGSAPSFSDLRNMWGWWLKIERNANHVPSIASTIREFVQVWHRNGRDAHGWKVIWGIRESGSFSWHLRA